MTTRCSPETNVEELKPGPIWGGWWFWEPPLGKTKETPEDTFRRLNPIPTRTP